MLRKLCLPFQSRDLSQKGRPPGFAEFWPTASAATLSLLVKLASSFPLLRWVSKNTEG